MFTLDQTLSDLALAHPAASRVFRKHRLDFCCGGRRPIGDACAERGLDARQVLAEIELEGNANASRDVRDLSLPVLVEHIQLHFHDAHRRELPDLIELARRVERVHADKPGVPAGLAAHLSEMQRVLEAHMQKEEQVLFPAIVRGASVLFGAPIAMMEAEHEEHGRALDRLRALTSNHTPPAYACTSWKALYLRCEQFEADLMAHINLENHVLFERALAGDA